MANPDHLARLKRGVGKWNSWRTANNEVVPDLSRANLSGANLSEADLMGAKLMGARLRGVSLSRAKLRFANLSRADLTDAILSGADLRGAILSGADLRGAYIIGADLSDAILNGANLYDTNLIETHLNGADLSDADLRSANLVGADLSEANFTRTDLRSADLSGAFLVRTRFTKANLTGCLVYGVAAWDTQLEGAIQTSLVITPDSFHRITVDDLEIAQFIYLLLNNKKVRHVIDTITSKVVLILGRFTPERKEVLDAIRVELRKRDYLTILFDFEKPSSKTTLETVSTLAHMARFVVADLTDAKSVLQELQAIVPFNPSVPVQPIILNSQSEPGMFDFFKRYPWMLRVYRYKDQDGLIAAVTDKVIRPAETRAKKLIGR
jgi:uncharacterized protein YjbI with pentapeptide repeats